MRYSLRGLVILTIVGPPYLAGIWLYSQTPWGSGILPMIIGNALFAVAVAIGLLILAAMDFAATAIKQLVARLQSRR